VAAATYLSPTYLTHWLHKEIGKTFTELVLERRTAEDVLVVVESDVQPDFILLPKTDSVLTGQKGALAVCLSYECLRVGASDSIA
jgi:AraC-like DNA-binding protein